MTARGDSYFMTYVYRGEYGERIPRGATHIIVREDVTVIHAYAFTGHPNIVEVICHDKVEKIRGMAFRCCPLLRRVIMPGVKIVELWAFRDCIALEDVECGQLEIIYKEAFNFCTLLRSINLPSARIVQEAAFFGCTALTDVKFGSKLERFEELAFSRCTSLERITIPLKDGMITDDAVFTMCSSLAHVDLVEGELLRENVAALHLEEWRNDIYKQIAAINQTLPHVNPGDIVKAGDDWEYDDAGEKAAVIRDWIRSVLSKINEYKVEHRRVLDEDVAPKLQHVLPQDIVRISVLPFLELPPNAFE